MKTVFSCFVRHFLLHAVRLMSSCLTYCLSGSVLDLATHLAPFHRVSSICYLCSPAHFTLLKLGSSTATPVVSNLSSSLIGLALGGSEFSPSTHLRSFLL